MHITPLLLSVCEGCPALSTYQVLFKQNIQFMCDFLCCSGVNVKSELSLFPPQLVYRKKKKSAAAADVFALNIFPVTAVFRPSSDVLLKVLFKPFLHTESSILKVQFREQP